MEPSEAYIPFMEAVRQKIFLSKTVIEYLMENESATYEDLLNTLQVCNNPPFLSHVYWFHVIPACSFLFVNVLN